ncbi:sidestep protein, putative [Pediculus humanus corporis]|uniref:Sidestep protein, putative n=1 Tax=Pediculus humanus subsp. corporis TaxID=121224 RepID=E0V964_PEDHC|nr:sidestep protein, putative [Pediculus humanus corporis]EEB09920.1 sidestep protein, putative [Pediculus humanus corporis]
MFNATFKCQASNSKLTLPLEKTTRLELNLKPLRVNILNKPKLLSADTEYAISCESVGSRPQAEITWWRENRRFRKGRVSTFI